MGFLWLRLTLEFLFFLTNQFDIEIIEGWEEVVWRWTGSSKINGNSKESFR